MLNITELTCRVCLEEQNILINIYDELEDLHTNLSNLLKICADLQIEKEDIFPKYLCGDCTRELLITTKFREKCDKSKEILGKILKQNDETIPEELDLPNDIIEYCVEELNIEGNSNLLIEGGGGNELEQSELKCDMINPIREDVSLSSLRRNDIDNSSTTEITKIVGDRVEIVTEETLTTESSSSEVIFNTEKLIAKDSEHVVAENLKGNKTAALLEVANVSSLKPLSRKLERFKIYKCDICGAIFKKVLNLQKHLQKSHVPLHCFNCSKCNHWFSLEAEYFKHMQICNFTELAVVNFEENKKKENDKNFGHNIEEETSRKCIYCKREFPTPSALRMHIRTHTGERPFQCKYCTKSFKTHSQLNVHHKRHTGQADFICSICNKAFYEQSNLTVHMRLHTGERPHACTVCNKTFTRVFLLQLHMRTHTGEKPYNCTYCDKSFRQCTDLRSHLTIHTGQKQHSCLLCGKSYIKRSHLLQHKCKHDVSTGNVESDVMVQYREDIYNDTDNTQSLVQNLETLYSFDEIIESDDVVLQTDKFG